MVCFWNSVRQTNWRKIALRNKALNTRSALWPWHDSVNYEDYKLVHQKNINSAFCYILMSEREKKLERSNRNHEDEAKFHTSSSSSYSFLFFAQISWKWPLKCILPIPRSNFISQTNKKRISFQKLKRKNVSLTILRIFGFPSMSDYISLENLSFVKMQMSFVVQRKKLFWKIENNGRTWLGLFRRRIFDVIFKRQALELEWAI